MIIQTSGWLVASYGSNPDISQISHIKSPLWRHHQRRGTVKPGIFSIAISCLIAVTVGIILQGSVQQQEKRSEKQRIMLKKSVGMLHNQHCFRLSCIYFEFARIREQKSNTMTRGCSVVPCSHSQMPLQLNE